MNFYSWLYGLNNRSEKAAMDADIPTDNWKEEDHPRESEGQKSGGRFRTSNKTVEKQDDLGSPTPTYEDLKRIYEEKGVCDELLDAAEGLFHGIVGEKVKPKRMPVEAFNTEAVSDLPSWLIAGYLVGSNYGNDNDRCKGVLLDFAKAAGKYKEDMYGDLEERYGEKIGDGAEADVFKTDDGRVAKASTLSLSNGSMEKVERIMLSNHHFPETAYSVEGLGEAPNGELLFELTQPWIDFSDEKMSDNEIEQWLEKRGRGWKMADSFFHNYVSKGNNLACLDMHDENVVKTKDGEIVCVDPCVVPNYYDLMLKGYYNYDDPPDSLE